MRNFFNVVWVGLLVLTAFSVATAVAATNAVPSTSTEHRSLVIGLNELKPPQCNGINLTNLVTGTGTLSGTGGNDLILGSSMPDIIDGAGGDDCILSGGDIDTITGDTGNDVCLGGPDTDVFLTCEVQSQ